MAFININKILLKNNILLFILFFIIINLEIFFCQINDGFENGFLENEGTNFIDINDYHNLNLIISTSKKIYKNIPPVEISEFSANIINYSKASTCNQNYLIVACLSDSLLSKIKIDSGESINLLNYDDVNINGDTITVPNSICSLSIFGNIVHIGISQIDSNDKVQNYIIQLNMINLDNTDIGPDIDTSIEKLYFKFPELIDKSDSMRQIICEVLITQDNNGNRLLCFYDKNVSGKRVIYGNSIKNDFSGFENKGEIKLYSFNSSPGFQIFKIDTKTIKCIMRKFSYLITLKNDGIIKSSKNSLSPCDSEIDLFFYNNDFVFSSASESTIKTNRKTYFIQINSIFSDNNYYKIYDYEINNDIIISNLLGYYYEQENKLLCIYTCSNNKIKYFILHDIKDIFQIKSFNKTIQLISYETAEIGISDIIQSSKDFGPLDIYKTTIITSSKKSEEYLYGTKSIDSEYFPIDKESKILYIPESGNNWYIYNFGFIEDTDDYLRIFYLEDSYITAQTCAFQCISCNTEFSKCNSCRDSNYAKLNGAEDTNCYPITQRMKGYIYDKKSKKFEKCYSSCDFCTKKGTESTSSQHNCESCAEGYYPSYEYQGNCYKINDGDNIVKDKNIAQIEDESFTLVTSCSSISKQFKINSTGECINECPTTSSYLVFQYTYVNFTVQTNQNAEQQYKSSNENPPKYSFNNLCFSECPSLTKVKDSTNICDCLYAWHSNSNSEKFCHEGNNCISNENKYYMDDTKECMENGCPDGYFQFNFICYKNSCPSNTNPSSTDSNKCESTYKYCYINEIFQNICSDTKNEEYKYKFDNTNQYLKLCDESKIYTTLEQKTYLYNEICYLICPEETNSDEENSKCICKFFGYYNDDNNNYICFTQEEKCKDLIPVIDLKKCLNTTDDCINKGYKIFDNECYSNNCPENTKLSDDDINCICSYYFYNESNTLNCFDISETCDTKNYSYSNPMTYECFINLEDCFSKNNLFFFNKNCYKNQCPTGKIALNSINNETIKNNLITELSINDDLINKICVCDIINSKINWNLNIEDELNFQICTNNCDEDYEPDPITRQCVEKCKPSKHFVFNDICYKKGCPSGSKLNESEPDSRICVCEKNSFFDIKNNITICCDEEEGTCPKEEEIIYPQEYLDNPEKCPTAFNGSCHSNCPEGTCITQKDTNLINCVPIKESMTVINNICFENIENLIQNINKNITSNNQSNGIQPILNSKDIAISGYFANEETYEESKDSNYSLLYLNDCEKLLKSAYNLPENSKLFILQIESRNREKKSAINSYSYAIFLENGTQLNDLSACDGVKLRLSSPIIDTEAVHLEEASYFASLNYDIYDENSEFYTSSCSPASIDGNDITLSDRKNDFYPSGISICNDSCQYNKVDLNSKRFECDCDINPSNNVNNTQNIIKEENFFDYVLSLINYKIIKCINLVFIKENFKNNVGTYLGLLTIVACLVLMVIFLTLGNKLINKKIFDGVPTKEKLEKKIEEQEKKRENILEEVEIYNKEKMGIEIDMPPKRKEVLSKLNISSSHHKINKVNEKKKENKLNLGQNDIIVHRFGKIIKKNGRRNTVNYNNLNIEDGVHIENYNDNTIEKNKESESKKDISLKSEKNIDKESEKCSQKKLIKISKFSILDLFRINKRPKTHRRSIKNKKIENLDQDNNSINNYYLQTDSLEMNKIRDENYRNYTLNDNKEIDKKEINILPYTKALRLDDRNFIQIFFSVLFNKIEIINIFYYKNESVHLSLTLSIYISSLLLDLTLNCLLYTDEEISEKYHNDGKLEFFTSISLSFFANIISGIIMFIVIKLTEYASILEIIIRDISDQNNYYINILRFKKYMKIKLSIFYIIQFILNVLMFYYLTIFCAVYNKTQGSIIVNYLYGILESLLFSLGLTITISLIRFLSIKYKWKSIYNASKYFYENF